MKLADSVMAGKASDGSIKWQLCYDISARTWWMASAFVGEHLLLSDSLKKNKLRQPRQLRSQTGSLLQI
ncbi:hypothetical protein G4228_013317 [Cervus hanglu yarkandensis]|nr:hypothetical protein G4228_013317 [Cervus hanglu yarkandensis]